MQLAVRTLELEDLFKSGLNHKYQSGIKLNCDKKALYSKVLKYIININHTKNVLIKPLNILLKKLILASDGAP